MSKELLSEELLSDIDRVAQETGFTGVLRIGDDVGAYGLADRAHGIANDASTRSSASRAAPRA